MLLSSVTLEYSVSDVEAIDAASINVVAPDVSQPLMLGPLLRGHYVVMPSTV